MLFHACRICNIATHYLCVLHSGTRKDKSVMVQEYILANSPEDGGASSDTNTLSKMTSILGMGGGNGKKKTFAFWK